MSPEELRADVNAAVEEFGQILARQDELSVGVRRKPTIEISETTLETNPFDFGIDVPPRSEVLPGDGGGITITYPRTGACCIGTDCFIETETECGTDGGEYQGDDTDCEEDTCVTGACCDALGSCFIKTSTGCTAIGGTYQGDGTDCDPNPCPVPCTCYFENGGNFYLTRTTVISGSKNDPLVGHGTATGLTETWNVTIVETYDGCTLNCSASGTTEDTYDSDPDSYGNCRNSVSDCTSGSIYFGIHFDHNSCFDCDSLDAPCSPQLDDVDPVVTYSNPCTPSL